MYIVTSNGAVNMELTAEDRPIPAQMHRGLAMLDGEKYFAYSIWYVPDDAGWPDGPGYRSEDHGDAYLQSAGTAERMSIEIRRLEPDGTYRLYAVGRPDDDAAKPDETVTYAGTDLRVRPSEVFHADEAADVYLHYYETDTVPEGYSLRLLDV